MKEQLGPERSVFEKGATFKFSAQDMRSAFSQGASFEREHQFMPPEVRPIKAAEEALARWPE